MIHALKDSALALLTGLGLLGAEPRVVTVPMTLDHNRMIVEVEFQRPDGSIRKAAAWVDTGNPDFMVSEALAKELQLDRSALKPEGPPHRAGSSSGAPAMRLGGMSLPTIGLKTTICRGDRVMPGLPAEANLPARAFLGRQLVLDYPARTLSLGAPGTQRPRGKALPCRINSATGLVEITAKLDGEELALGLDTGSSGSWIAEERLRGWGLRHPDWPQCVGAAGSANFFGFPFEAKGILMRLPTLEIGPLRASGESALGLEQPFFDWYSQKSAGPVQGFLGGNVLRGFRLEIDFPAQTSYWEAAGPHGMEDLDIVGLTLRPEPSGQMVVAGIVQQKGRPCVEEIQPGDTLLQVDGREVRGATLGQVMDRLRGQPGSRHSLKVERGGRVFEVWAPVLRLP